MTERTWASERTDSAPRRYGVTTKLLSYLSGAWCGISLLAISASLTVSTGNQLGKALLIAGDNPGHFVGKLVGVFIGGALIVLGLGVASGRFLVRALPPTILNESRHSQPWAVALCATFFSVFTSRWHS